MVQVGRLKIKAQVRCGEDMAIGPGKADVLEAIDRAGSISGAGRSMGMSYRRTWLLVDSMNRCWLQPLVEASPGGGASKGARLTPMGREVLAAFRALETELATAATSRMAVLADLLVDQPRSGKSGKGPDEEADEAP